MMLGVGKSFVIQITNYTTININATIFIVLYNTLDKRSRAEITGGYIGAFFAGRVRNLDSRKRQRFYDFVKLRALVVEELQV